MSKRPQHSSPRSIPPQSIDPQIDGPSVQDERLSASFMQRQPRRAAQSGPSLPPTASHSSFLCRHPWPLARTRATNYGLSTARPSRARPRTYGPSASAGGKALVAALIRLPPHVISQRHPTAPPATGIRQSPPEAASEPQQASPHPNLTCSTSKRKRASDSLT
jgi:hypothetical protein